MKKMFFTCAMFAAVLNVSAQKKSWYVGGNVGFNSSTEKGKIGGNTVDLGKSTSWQFSPEVGTFLTDNIQLGLGLTFSGEKTDDQSTPNLVTKTTTTGATAYVRNFFGKKMFRPFVGLNVSVLPGTKEIEFASSKTEYNVFNIGANVNAGFAYNLSERVSVIGSFGMLGFSNEVEKNKSNDSKITTTNFGFNANSLGNRFNVGFYYTFKK